MLDYYFQAFVCFWTPAASINVSLSLKCYQFLFKSIFGMWHCFCKWWQLSSKWHKLRHACQQNLCELVWAQISPLNCFFVFFPVHLSSSWGKCTNAFHIVSNRFNPSWRLVKCFDSGKPVRAIDTAMTSHQVLFTSSESFYSFLPPWPLSLSIPFVAVVTSWLSAGFGTQRDPCWFN